MGLLSVYVLVRLKSVHDQSSGFGRAATLDKRVMVAFRDLHVNLSRNQLKFHGIVTFSWEDDKCPCEIRSWPPRSRSQSRCLPLWTVPVALGSNERFPLVSAAECTYPREINGSFGIQIIILLMKNERAAIMKTETVSGLAKSCLWVILSRMFLSVSTKAHIDDWSN